MLNLERAKAMLEEVRTRGAYMYGFEYRACICGVVMQKELKGKRLSQDDLDAEWTSIGYDCQRLAELPWHAQAVELYREAVAEGLVTFEQKAAEKKLLNYIAQREEHTAKPFFEKVKEDAKGMLVACWGCSDEHVRAVSGDPR